MKTIKNFVNSSLKPDIGTWAFIFIHLYLVFRPVEIAFFSTYYPLYAIALIGLGLNFRKITYSSELQLIISCCLALTAIAVLNSYLNDAYSRRYLLHWCSWLIVVLFIAAIFRKNINAKVISNVAKVVISIEFVIVLIQLYEPTYFGNYWSSIKNVGLDGFVRVSGTFTSPLAFASFMTYLLVWIVAEQGIKKSTPWILLTFVMVIMSSSRTLMLIFPFIFGASIYLSVDDSLIKRMASAALYTSFLFVFLFVFLFSFKNTFIYSAELLSILPKSIHSEKEISKYHNKEERQKASECKYKEEKKEQYKVYALCHKELRTMDIRSVVWKTALKEFYDKDLLDKLKGDGLNFSNHGAHQDPLYILTRYGFIGFGIFLFLISILLSLGYKNRFTFEGKLLYLTTLLLIGMGLVNTIAVEMRFGILSALCVGVLLARTSYKPAAIEFFKSK
jgi:hypothetical protein